MCARVGCNVGGIFINVLAYADDIVLLAPAWRAMQQLLDILSNQACMINMQCNVGKTVCMVFPPRKRKMQITSTFPVFNIGGLAVQFVHTFKYLGHIINSRLSDDDDIQREIRNLFMRANILARKFKHCSRRVKTILFKSYCICFYDASLWARYSKGKINKLRSCYNRCIKLFFSYQRCDSMTHCLTWGCTVLIQYYQTAVLYLETNCMHVITILLVIYCRNFLIVVGSSFILSFLCVCFFCYMDHCCLN